MPMNKEDILKEIERLERMKETKMLHITDIVSIDYYIAEEKKKLKEIKDDI